MKTLVERIRNRELAIENDGTIEELRKAVKYIFPNSILDPHGNVKYYFAEENDFDSWNGYSDTYLPTVSVKEVLAEIEGEGKQTKVIYLNEEDKPKVEEPLSFTEWINKTWDVKVQHLTNYTIDCEHQRYIEYRNNFKPNDKPIEFLEQLNLTSCKWKDTAYTPNAFEQIEYRGNGIFWASMSHYDFPVIFKGNLNNGKVN